MMKIFSIYDRVAEEFGPVFVANNQGVAMRQFKNLMDEQKLNQEEYWLFELGEYDEKTGTLIPIDKIERVEKEAMLSFEVKNE